MGLKSVMRQPHVVRDKVIDLQQITGHVAGQCHLRQHHQVASLGFGSKHGVADLVGGAVKITGQRIDLSQGEVHEHLHRFGLQRRQEPGGRLRVAAIVRDTASIRKTAVGALGCLAAV